MIYPSILTICVPTYNHPTFIKKILDNFALLEPKKISLIIYDGSENDLTQEVTKQYHYSSMSYFHFPQMNFDERVLKCLSSVNTKYCFLCGDGYSLNPNSFEHIFQFLHDGFDLIEVYDSKFPVHFNYFCTFLSIDRKPVYYDDIRKHFEQNYWHMPFYGATIVKAEVFRNGFDDYSNSVGGDLCFDVGIYTYYANHSFRGVVLTSDFLIPNPSKKEGYWAGNELFLHTWAFNLYNSIMMLPDYYNSYKHKVLKTFGKRTGFLTFRSLISLKRKGGFKFKEFKKYHFYISRCSYVNSFEMLIVLLIPRFFLNFLHILKTRMRKNV